MKLRHKAPLVLVLAASGIFGGTAYVCYSSQLAYIKTNKDERLNEIATDVTNGLSGMQRAASGYGEMFAAMPVVKESLRAEDRKKLAAELVPSFKLMKAKYGVDMVSFHSAALVTFLRLSNPDFHDVHADDQSKREMIVRATHLKETQAGLEVSVRGVGVRAVAPVVDEQGVVGCVEWGMNFDRLLDRLKVNTGAQFAIFIDEKTIPAPVTSQGVEIAREVAKAAEADRVAEGYRTVQATDNPLMKRVIPGELLPSVQQQTVRYVVVGDKEYGLVATPLHDFGGRPVGVVVGVRDLDAEHRLAKQTRILFLIATLAGVILLAGAVQIVFNGFLVRPLDELSEDLEKITHGDPLARIEMAKRTDEIGTLAKRLEKLREKVVMEKDPAKP